MEQGCAFAAMLERVLEGLGLGVETELQRGSQGCNPTLQTGRLVAEGGAPWKAAASSPSRVEVLISAQ